jgi:hypothetical protein
VAAPTSYTEETLGQLMHSELGAIATALGYTNPSGSAGAYAEWVNEALLEYGVDAVSSVSGRDNIRRLRALARVQAWKRALTDLAALHDNAQDGQSFDLSQMFAMAKAKLEQASSDASAAGADSGMAGYVVGKQRLLYRNDPYKFLPDELRTP